MPSSQTLQALSHQWRDIARKLQLRECRERMEKVAATYDRMAAEQAERETVRPLVVLPTSSQSRGLTDIFIPSNNTQPN